MKLFISWSGPTSHKVATALRDWLPCVLQPVKPFLSDIDISKGKRWNDVLTQELKDAAYGIVCVTPYNLQQPWMNFEAGMLSGFFDRSSLMPLLFGVEQSAVTGPLSQFQSALCNEDDIRSMLFSINYKLGSAKLEHDVLSHTFKVWWKELKDELDKIPPQSTQDETRTAYKWLYVAKDLDFYETEATQAIWIVTSSIFKYASSPNAREIVNKNLDKGISYCYFLPNSEELNDDERNALRELRKMADKSNDKLRLNLIPKKDFDRGAATDYVIINPDNDTKDHGPPRRMFLRLPIEDVNDYWVELDERSTLNMRNRFRDLLDSVSPVSETPKVAQKSTAG